MHDVAVVHEGPGSGFPRSLPSFDLNVVSKHSAGILFPAREPLLLPAVKGRPAAGRYARQVAKIVSDVGNLTRRGGSHEWEPITDLSIQDARSLADSELAALSTVWNETREELDSVALAQFNERLSREMAIETGVIERIYTLDRGITQLLIEKGIDAALIPREATDQDPDLVAALITDQEEAVEGLFDFVRGRRALSTSYIKELHASLTRHQPATTARDALGRLVTIPLERGAWKTLPNNPTRPDGSRHEYCPPEQVASEMDELVELHLAHEQQEVAAEVEAAWLHHRFTQIHPLQDGNGRVARCLASLVFIRDGWFPLTITRDHRDTYISALEEADDGELKPLVALFSRRQRDVFLGALAIVADIKRAQQRVGDVIAAARDDIRRRQELVRKDWERSKETARRLEGCAKHRLEDTAERLTDELGSLDSRMRFHAGYEPYGGERDFWFRRNIIDTARALGNYFADVAAYRAWASAIMWTADSRAEIVVSFHGIGREFRGVLGVSAFFFWRDERDGGGTELRDLTPLTDEVFQINYVEPTEDAVTRFEPWLDNVLMRGLETWRRGF